jgi:hypothetical protein
MKMLYVVEYFTEKKFIDVRKVRASYRSSYTRTVLTFYLTIKKFVILRKLTFYYCVHRSQLLNASIHLNPLLCLAILNVVAWYFKKRDYHAQSTIWSTAT